MDQAKEPFKTTTHQHHPEEGEPHENGASKMFRKVKARAKKFKNSITNHGQSHEHDHDVVEEDDDDDELEPEVIDSPGGVKGKHESLSHPRETNVPAPEEIVPPGTKVFPVVSSDHSKPVEPVPQQETAYGHESLFQNARTTDTSAPAHSVRATDRSDKEERSDVPTHQPLSEREESRETHHESLNTPVSQLSGTEDVPRTFATDEDDHLGGQRKVNFETPKKLEDDPAVPGGGSDYLSGVSNHESKVTDPTKEGSGEAGVPEISDSLARMNVSDEFADHKSGQGFDGGLSTRSKEFRQFDQDFDSVLGKDSPPKFGGESGVQSEKHFPTKSHTEYGIDKNSPAGFGGESRVESEKDIHDFDMKTESGLDKNSPSRTHEFDLKTESGSPMEIRSESGAELEKELPRGSNEFDQKVESGRNEYSPESDGGLGAPMGGNFPVRSHELDHLKDESGIDKDTPTGFDGEPDFLAEGRPGYGEDPEEKNFSARSDHDVKLETELGRDVPTGTHDQFSPELSRPKERDETKFPVRSDHDVKLETELGRDVPTGTHDQFSPDISRPKERDEFEESRDNFEETRDETTQEAKPSTYTEKFASMLGYSGEGTVGDQTQVAGTVDEKLTPVNEKERETESPVTTKLPFSGGGSGLEETKETESPVTTKLPLSGGGSGLEETKETESPVTTKLPLSGGGSGLEKTEQVEDKDVSGRDYLAEKLTPGEEENKTTTKDAEVTVEKPPTEKISAVGEHGEAVEEEAKGGGMVGMIKGWFGGAATEEVKPNSPHSVEEAPKSTGWFGGGATEEVKPKSPHSVEESPQSLGSTVGTKGFPDSGGDGGGAVPVQKGL